MQGPRNFPPRHTGPNARNASGGPRPRIPPLLTQRLHSFCAGPTRAGHAQVPAATLAPNGSPPITRTTFPTCRAHYPGGSSGCACRLLPRITRPSPNGRRVGIRIVTFEACSGFTHVTARRIAQPPIGDLCHEAPTHAVTRTSRSSATGSIDNSPGGFFLH
jgi:hypothetical protein